MISYQLDWKNVSAPAQAGSRLTKQCTTCLTRRRVVDFCRVTAAL